MTKKRSKRKTVIGVVTSDKMLKTITVQSEKLVKHPRYGKYVKRVTAYKAHDEENKASNGNKVEIAETRPLSKTKRWKLVRVVK
ncbi:MAG: 30S ribosomal protein S17 [Candidatus Scalindua rubra]|uniref:Small ribosomal subunit protein uS17 n=1 Tax=Candidatus Scalindua rubra TaxID=1872076 RepID=A0A1E3XDW7_9BACT|nr:MAG: 30S ribosomal protein S17 [Candidatus Scalindua rubra]